MLKILFNTSTLDIPEAIQIKLSDMSLSITVGEYDGVNNINRTGYDVIESLSSYNSYMYVHTRQSSKVKVYREIFKSGFRFLDLNRLGVATKLDFADLTQLYGGVDIAQVDTGIISSTERDIVIRIFQGKVENTIIDSDMNYEIGYFSPEDLITGAHPRDSLWDYYSLTCDNNNIEYKSSRYGNFLGGFPDSVVMTPDSNGYIDFTIKKYKGKFENELTRDIDDEDVLIETSAGLANPRRVTLENGVGHFRLITFGYTGRIKIKLGRKWYEVWNEYNLIIG